MVAWLRDHQSDLFWMGGLSAIVMVAAALGAHAFIVRLPPDYMRHSKRPPLRLAVGSIPPSVIVVLKNVVGVLCIVAGLAMVVLPGPGLVVGLVGFLMVDFPGKYPAEKWLLSRPKVLAGINWLRRRKDRPPLQPPSDSPAPPRLEKSADLGG